MTFVERMDSEKPEGEVGVGGRSRCCESNRQSGCAGKTGTTEVVVDEVIERARYRGGVVRVTGAIRRQPLAPSSSTPQV